MQRIRRIVRRQRSPSSSYEPLTGDSNGSNLDRYGQAGPQNPPFSWLKYTIFLLLGISMLWAW